MTNRTKVLDRIAKLQAMVEGTTNLAEAEAFAAKVSALLTEHKLTMTEIEFADYDGTPVGESRIDGDEFGGRKWKRSRWQLALARGIAKSNGCSTLAAQGCNAVWFVGHEADRDVCAYLFTSLVPKLEKISKREHRAKKREQIAAWGYNNLPTSWRQSWLVGAARGIGAQLKQQRRQAEAAGGSLALVRLDDTAVVEYMAENYRRRGAGFGGNLSGDALAAGKSYGATMPITTGVGSGTGSRQLRGG